MKCWELNFLTFEGRSTAGRAKIKLVWQKASLKGSENVLSCGWKGLAETPLRMTLDRLSKPLSIPQAVDLDWASPVLKVGASIFLLKQTIVLRVKSTRIFSWRCSWFKMWNTSGVQWCWVLIGLFPLRVKGFAARPRRARPSNEKALSDWRLMCTCFSQTKRAQLSGLRFQSQSSWDLAARFA